MKAIILAAGIGRRMRPFTETNHKSMLKIGGKSLMEHNVRCLTKAGIKEIVIVTGYCREQIKAKLRENCSGVKITYVDNEEYKEKGHLYSLSLAKEHMDKGFLVMDADLIFDSRIIKQLLESEYPNALLYGSLENDSGEEVKVCSKNGKPTKIGKVVEFGEDEILEGESVGMMRYSEEFVPMFIADMEKILVENPMADHDEQFVQLWCDKGIMNMVKTDKTWMEIDFPHEVDKARNEVYPKILKEEEGRDEPVVTVPEQKRDFKLLLIQANSTLDTLIPPNLAIISAVLKQAGIQVKLFDTTFYKTRDFTGDDARVRTLQVQETNFEELGITLNTTNMYDDFMEVVKKYQPDLVGLSAVELTYPFGIKFLKRLRDEGLTIPTIVGGVHATLSPEEVLNEDCVDYICVGEGEYALKELCEALRDDKDTRGILNIWSKKNNEIIKNPVRPPVNMNELPFQDLEIFDQRRLFKPMGGKIRKTGCFELNRGCPYSCTYCCNEFFHKLYNYKNYRERSVRKFIDEVKIMKEKYDLAYIYISAESFLSTKQERFEEFVKLWREEIKLPFWAETRPESITEERVKLLEEAGCTSMSIGVESGSLEIRKMLNRHMSNEKIKEAFKALKKTNLRIGANSILGFPGETREQVFETIELNRQINADNSMIHVFNPYRGTQLFDTCVEKGYISKDTLGGDYRADAMLKMPQLSQEEILGLQRTFALYVKLPKERWPEIRIAEKFDEVGNQKFAELKKEYTATYFNGDKKKKVNKFELPKRKILLNPGPATTSETVKMAQIVPDICPREKEFGDLIKDVRADLLKVINANPDKYSCILFGGSGTLAVESVISSVVPEDGKLLIINNGAYGERQKQIAEAYSLPYHEWKLDQTKMPDLEEFKQLIDSDNFTHVSFVHHETTTGLLNPLKELTEIAKSKDLSVIVDTVSSFAGIPIDLSELNVDFIVSTSNKCIQGMAGLAFVIGKKDLIEQSKIVAKRSLYLNLYDQYICMNEKGQFRFTPPVQTLYALKQAIFEFFEEGGVEGRHKRYAQNWETLIQGIEDLGLQNLISKKMQSKILISIKYPHADFDFEKLHDSLYEKGFTIYPGKLGKVNTFRLSTLGDINKNDITSFLLELKQVLVNMGVVNLEEKDYSNKKGWDLLWEKKGEEVKFNTSKLSGYEYETAELEQNLVNLTIDEIKSKLELSKEDKLLEIGCAAGRLLIPLAEHVKSITGTDLSKSLINRLKGNLDAELHVCGADRLPFEDESFDKVLINAVLYYFPDLEYAKRAIQEAFRVCKKGGKILILDITDKDKKEIYNTCRNSRDKKTKDPSLVHLFYEKDFFRNLCNELNLTYEMWDQDFLEYPNLNHKFSILMDKPSARKIQKIMLINPSNTIAKDSVRRVATPLGLLYLGAVLRDAGYDVNVLDSPCEGYSNTVQEDNYLTYGLSDEKIVKRVKEYNPDLVAVTSMFSARQNNAIHHCDLIKSVNKNIPVVLGGIHPSLFPRESIQHSSVNYIIMGEGEFRLLDLVNALNENKTDFDFDGITYQKDGDIMVKPVLKAIEDLDTLPLPARDLIDIEKYIEIGVPSSPFSRKERVEQIMVSRGCPFSCVFCSTVRYWGRKFRMRSVESMIKEVDELVNKYNIEEIQFNDDNLTVNKTKAKEFFRRLKEYNLAWCTPHGIMLKTVDEEMIHLMAESGAYQLTFAVESGSERVLKEIIHKEVPPKETVTKYVKLCQDLGIQVHGLFVVGFPGETREEIMETLQYPFSVGFDSISIFIANPMPGSELYDICKEKGYLVENPTLDLKNVEIKIPEDSPDFIMPSDELVKLVDDKTREFNEFSKTRNPGGWEIKFKQFLKKHGDKADLILGRVT